jgi:hypothetical protein
MSPMEQLTSEYTKQLALNNYKMMIITKYDKGKLSYEKALRLEAKVNQWMRVQKGNNLNLN